MYQLDVCFSPALFQYYPQHSESIVIVTDIFRATSTICTALEAGTEAIIPIGDLVAAETKSREGYLVAAERNVKKCDFAAFGNSPFEYTVEAVKGKKIILTTTNGTQAIEKASGAKELLAGSFLNLSSITNYCIGKNTNILVLCSGWENRFSMEDALFAGAALEKLMENTEFQIKSDTAAAALTLWKHAKANLKKALSTTEHFDRLLKNNLEKDIDHCLSIDKLNVLPYYQKECNQIVRMSV
jgi:2-phosphosulfolactate phosphatase